MNKIQIIVWFQHIFVSWAFRVCVIAQSLHAEWFSATFSERIIYDFINEKLQTSRAGLLRKST